jgi:hypothetical protein
MQFNQPQRKNETKHCDNYPLNNINRPVTFAARFAFHPARFLPLARRPRRHCQRGHTVTSMPWAGLPEGNYNLQ